MGEERSFVSIVRDVGDGLRGVVRSELRLAASEFQVTAQDIRKHMVRAIVIGVIALVSIIVGMMPLVAFLVIALGQSLNDNYLVSSLVIGMAFVAIGIVATRVAMRSLKQISEEDLRLPMVRESVRDNIKKIREAS